MRSAGGMPVGHRFGRWRLGAVVTVVLALAALVAAPAVALPSEDKATRFHVDFVLNRDGSVADGSGRTILTNANNGEGPWTAVDAPVNVPNPEVNYCQNYSSPLLPSEDGTQVLELASDFDGSVCRTYYATGPLP